MCSAIRRASLPFFNSFRSTNRNEAIVVRRLRLAKVARCPHDPRSLRWRSSRFSNHFPQRIFRARSNERGMRRGEKVFDALRHVQLAHEIHHAHADAGALVIGQHYRPRAASSAGLPEHRKRGVKRDGLFSPHQHVTPRGRVKIVAQIMMLPKHRPSAPVAAMNVDSDFRVSPKRPPFEARRAHIV